jgi:vitamin B12 transporter
MNLGTMTTEGIEMEAHGKIGTRFLLAGNFSYLRGKHRFNYESVDTVKSEGNHVQLYANGGFVSTGDVHSLGLTRRPVTANLSLTYTPSNKVFVKAVWKYVSKRNDVIYDNTLGPYGALGKSPVAAYSLADLMAGFRFNTHLSGLMRVENIFNVSYSEIRGFASRGRGVYFTVNYSF